MGQENFGVMRIPVWGKGKLAPTYTVTAQGLGITSWSKVQKQAADFLIFMHTTDRLNAWYAATGVFPADDRFDTSKVSIPQMKQVFQWIKARPGSEPGELHPQHPGRAGQLRRLPAPVRG